MPLNKFDYWKALTLEYDASAVWRISPINSGALAQFGTQCDKAQDAACVCSQLTNTSDPYCGIGGAVCRQRYRRPASLEHPSDVADLPSGATSLGRGSKT